jgi:hypothetical protein
MANGEWGGISAVSMTRVVAQDKVWRICAYLQVKEDLAAIKIYVVGGGDGGSCLYS